MTFIIAVLLPLMLLSRFYHLLFSAVTVSICNADSSLGAHCEMEIIACFYLRRLTQKMINANLLD